jgi:uncharacterized protein
MADGEITWFELDVPDPASAKTFYSAVLGWSIDPYPEMPTYQFVNVGEKMIGALQQSDKAAPSGRGVTLYFQVADLEGTLARAKSAGGTVEAERHEVPGGQWFGQFRDPFGQLVGLLTSNPAA